MLKTESAILIIATLVVACGESTEPIESGSGAAGGNGGSSGNLGAGGTRDGGAGVGAASGTGGNGIGGTGGSSGAAGSGAVSGSGGSGGAGATTSECTENTQCRLHADCCTCLALAPGEPAPPKCAIQCIQDKCSELGVTAASVRCAAGVCAAGFTCSGQVLCPALPPKCEPGSVPTVSGGCWGTCVPADECASVSDCAQCTDPLEICVTYVTQRGPENHCVPVPKGCEGKPTCQCLGSSVCLQPFSSCSEKSGVRGANCDCPNC